MDLGERRDRHQKLLARVRKNDIVKWRTDFLNCLRGEAA